MVDAQTGACLPRCVDDEQHMIFECSTFEDLRDSVDGARVLIDSSAGVVCGEMSVVREACMDRLDNMAVHD